MRENTSASGAEAPARSNRDAPRGFAETAPLPETGSSGTVIAPDPGLWRRSPGSAGLVAVGGWTKRAFDIVGAIAAIVLLAPLLLLVWVAVRVERNGPAIFRQARGGFGGQPFEILKFRTMVCAENGSDVRQVQVGDARITPLGRFLRQTSWDELPQLFNVLRGDMSLIGPRPHALEHDRLFATIDATYPLRFNARPGITGLAQVSGCRGPTETDDKVRARTSFDVEYVTTWSLMSDIRIVLRTLMMFARHDPGAV